MVMSIYNNKHQFNYVNRCNKLAMQVYRCIRAQLRIRVGQYQANYQENKGTSGHPLGGIVENKSTSSIVRTLAPP